MKHSITLPEWSSAAWFARQLYPDVTPGAARTRFSRKLSGKRAWNEEELDKLSQIFYDLEGANFSSELDFIMDEIFGPKKDEYEDTCDE